eukprot:CAMPEP_0195511418 /NCGR_PEP_ID=MMETSP0794_2-20130614/3742_1 /TAXON_ID=515487 /ORGANISM="Stephanopyxis turris, Strain CCMP 815" /LENGTH=236 /DNA_ID=CAMNT_0040639009 /DNA_START=208 /DNA_END=915 /DNA_ORIENTATION=+
MVGDISEQNNTLQSLTQTSPTINNSQGTSISKDASGLKLAWLMSFPNSGTSYTMKLVAESTNLATASNYGQEGYNTMGQEIPVFNNISSPFIATNGKFPEAFILTKTHCSMRCAYCPPSKYFVEADSFQEGCLMLSNVIGDKKDKKTVPYNAELVGKAVHLFRNPFDNIISRFHMYGKNEKRLERDETKYSNDAAGFKEFCTDKDAMHVTKETKFFGESFVASTEGVPCHSDFYRY